MIIQE
jgi:hypothetical protein